MNVISGTVTGGFWGFWIHLKIVDYFFYPSALLRLLGHFSSVTQIQGQM